MSTRPPRSRSQTNRPGRAGERGRQVQQKRTNKLWIWGPLALLVLVVVVVAVVLFNRSPVELTGVQTYENLSRDHVEGAQAYDPSPPVGGAHNGRWLNCGIYDQPVPNENAVHSLEHGAVWITYRPDLPAADVEQLRSLARGRRYVLLSPFPNAPTAVVASAWGVQLRVDSASDARIASFIQQYENGPQTPEPGASCRGGIGNPVER